MVLHGGILLIVSLTGKTMTREELIEMSGQIINGIMSSDSSFFTKVIDRSVLIDSTAKMTVRLAKAILKEIDKD